MRVVLFRQMKKTGVLLSLRSNAPGATAARRHVMFRVLEDEIRVIIFRSG